MRVLYITPYVPSRIRTRPYQFVRRLAAMGQQVRVLAVSGAAEAADVEALQSEGISVEAFSVSKPRALGNCVGALPSGEPLQAHYGYHPQMAQRVAELTGGEQFGVVHIEHLRAARLVRAVRMQPVIYDSVDCISLLFEQTSRTSPQWRARLMARLDLQRTRRYEGQLMARFAGVAVTSGRDRDALRALAERYAPRSAALAPITVITNGVDLDYFRPDASYGERSPNTVVFSGKISYHANVAAVLYFAREALPRIWAVRPDVRYTVVGKDPPAVVQRLARDPRIEVTGYVDDLRPYLGRATAAVCAVPYGVGIQNKVLEAMAMGVPVVTTPASAAALTAQNGRDLLVANDSQGLADAVLQIISDRDLADRLGKAGRHYVETHHDWDLSTRQLIGLYEQVQGG